jgi:hypothetical protein
VRPKIIPQRHARRPRAGEIVVLIALACGVSAAGQAERTPPGKAKPSLTLRVNPPVGFAPARIVATAELVGGSDDYEEFYCSKVEWEWSDDSTSSSKDDCDPYQAGTSKIRRRFTLEHTYHEPGRYEIMFRLKQGSTVVATVKTPVEIRGEGDRAQGSVLTEHGLTPSVSRVRERDPL